MRESHQIEAAVSRAEEASPMPDPVDPRQFRDALGRFATGVTVITTCEADGAAPVGITANSFASVSLDPALVLWSAARSSMRHRHFSVAQAFAVHVLGFGQQSLAQRFTGKGEGFAGLDHRQNAEGVPVFDDVLARFECRTEATHEGGDHTIIIGRVIRFALCREGEPLVFAGGRYGRFEPS